MSDRTPAVSDRTPLVSDRPTFAVVIPTYNRATRLVNTLETVFRQEEAATEIIVIDNCSTDETPDVMSDLMETHANLGYIRHDANLERAVSRNTGMSKATADYVTFLDSDDLMYRQNLREAGDFVVETRANFFHSLYESVDEDGRHVRYWPVPSLRNHIRSIEVNYARSPAYADYAGDLFDAIDAGHRQLAGLTIGVIRWLRQALGIGTDLRLASEIGGAGHRADLLADLCRKVGAREYVSPPGSRAYLDDSDAFEQAGIPVRYHDYAHPTYRQAHGEFLPYMSVVDQMMNEGDRSLAIIRSGYR